MEQLSKSQQEAVRKNSTDRLREILSKANWAESTVLTAMSREEMLEAVAQLEVTRAKAAAGEPSEAPGVDPAVERDRLQFEKYKFDMEMKKADDERALQREKLAAESKRLADAAALEMKKLAEQRDFELKKLAETAAIEAEKAAAQRQHEIELKQLEQEHRVSQADEDRARNDSVAARLKRYGDAMRNAMTRQGPDPIETVSFFRNAENLFRTLEVPQDLRAVLIRPFLNDKAKALIARLEPHHASDYDALKALILRENKLTPTTYREKFTTLKKAEGETYVMYSSRLLAMLESYHQSRSVSGFKDLVELLLCDRLKLALSPELLKQVLSVESTVENGWLQSKLLAELIDNFVANHVGDRLRTGASGNEPPNYENGKGKGPNPQTEKEAAAPENAGDGEKKTEVVFYLSLSTPFTGSVPTQ